MPFEPAGPGDAMNEARSIESREMVTIGDVTVTVLSRTRMYGHGHGSSFIVQAKKEPVAVIVEDREGEKTLTRFRSDGRPL